MATIEPTRAISGPDLIGAKVVNRFSVTRHLGAGGMGEVFLASDDRLKRNVVIKRLAPHLRNDDRYRHRLRKEAERAARFNLHPNIAAILDVVEEEGEVFLVMEHVEGQDLRHAALGHLSLQTFLSIAMQCAQGVAAAHAVGVQHRDIKPENIMLRADGMVKVLDFGLARDLLHGGPLDVTVTQSAESLAPAGTAGYVAPEVLREEQPDERADIFSLGVVFYELLTRRNPFRTDSFLGTCDRILHLDPPPVRQSNSAAPPELERIVRKMLAKNREERYATVADLLVDLRAVGRDRSKRITPRWQKWKAAAWGCVAIVAGLVGWVLLPPTPPVLKQSGWVLVSDIDGSGEDLKFERAVQTAMTIALQQSRYLNVFPRSRAYEALQRMKRSDSSLAEEALAREVCRREGIHLLLAGSVLSSGEVVRISFRGIEPMSGEVLFVVNEQFRRREELFDRIDRLAARVRHEAGESEDAISRDAKPLAKVTTSSLEALQLYSEALNARMRGDMERIPQLLESALALDPDFASGHLLLGQYYGWIVSKNERAVAELEKAYQLRETVTERERRRIEASYFTLVERYEDAAESLRVLATLSPDDPEVHTDLAVALANLGRSEEAIIEFRRVLQLKPDAVAASGNLARLLARTNAVRETERFVGDMQARGVTSPSFDWALGLAAMVDGRLQEAEQHFRRLEAQGGRYRSVGQLYRARTLVYAGKIRAAIAELQAGMSLDEPENPQGQKLRQYLLGRAHLLLGDRQSACQAARAIAAGSASEMQTINLLHAGQLFSLCGERQRAEMVAQELRNVSESAPSSFNRSAYLLVAGEIALAQTRYGEAESHFRTAAAEYPQYLPTEALARTYSEQRDWSKAAEKWQKVVAKRGEILQDGFGPDLILAELKLAEAYYELGQIEQARDARGRAERLWGAAEPQLRARVGRSTDR